MSEPQKVNLDSVILIPKKYFLLLSLLIVSCGGGDTATKTTAVATTEQRFTEAKSAYEKGDYLDAIRIFEEVRVQAPTSELASQATYYEAMARFKQEMYSGAAVDFRSLGRVYPTSTWAPRAQYMVGESYYQLSPRPELDQSYAALAVAEYQNFLRLYPTATQSLRDSAQVRITDIRTKLAEKNFLSAELYSKMEDSKSALVYYNRVLDQFYDTRFAAAAALRIAEVQYDRKKMGEARKALETFDEKYLETAATDLRQRAQKLHANLP